MTKKKPHDTGTSKVTCPAMSDGLLLSLPDTGNNLAGLKHSLTESDLSANRSTSEHIRLSILRTNNALCIILTVGPLVASTVAFCITRSPLSFIALLPVLSQVPNLRRRLEEFAFPISQEDLQIRLKELDVEAKRIEKQSTAGSIAFFNWLRRPLSKWSK